MGSGQLCHQNCLFPPCGSEPHLLVHWHGKYCHCHINRIHRLPHFSLADPASPPPTHPLQRARLLPTIRFPAFDRLPHVPRCHLFVFAWREFLPTGLHEARELEILASHITLKSRLQPANPFLSLFHLSHPLPLQGRCTAHQFVSLSSELHFARTASQPNA